MRRSVLPLALSLLVLMTGAKARIPAVPARQPSPAGSSLVDVTVHEGTSMAVALSPDRTTLVIDLQGGLWTLPVGGGTAKRITDEYNDARQPSWSPDGKRIAFQGYRDGTWRIWSVTPDGGDLKAMTSGSFDDREPTWSPDGRKIAFSSDRTGNYDVWVLDVASGKVDQVTKNDANDFQPAWSADGRELAFVSTRTPSPGVYATTLDGRERLVAAADGNLGAPSWSPDGRVLYTVMPGGGGFGGGGGTMSQTQLKLGDQQLGSGEDYHPFHPQWLSADEFIYAADGRIKRRSIRSGSATPIEFTATLHVAPASYTRKTRDFDSTAPQPVKGIIHPVLSPDGKQLTFAALGDIWTMALGGTPTRLTDDLFVDTDPSWSPDGT
jgi:Tol biopolymer transport system component